MRTTPSRPAQLAIGALSLAVVAIHVIDQGGIVGDKAPRYVGIGYWLLELAGLAVCALLAVRSPWAGLLAAAVAAGPIAGYVLSRGPGLPGYTDDRGNWGETLGLLSIAVEAILLALALGTWARRREVVVAHQTSPALAALDVIQQRAA